MRGQPLNGTRRGGQTRCPLWTFPAEANTAAQETCPAPPKAVTHRPMESALAFQSGSGYNRLWRRFLLCGRGFLLHRGAGWWCTPRSALFTSSLFYHIRRPLTRGNLKNVSENGPFPSARRTADGERLLRAVRKNRGKSRCSRLRFGREDGTIPEENTGNPVPVKPEAFP